MHFVCLTGLPRSNEEGLDIGFDAFPDWFLDGFLRNLENPSAIGRLRRENLLQRIGLGVRFEDRRLMGAADDPELKELEGLDFAAIGRRLGMSPVNAEVYVARRTRGEPLS